MKTALPLRQLVSRLGALSIEGALSAPVAGLAYDPRRVVPGTVFFAVPRRGVPEDGQAIPRAIERGAAAIVCEHLGFVPYRATRIRVANCRRALANVAASFHGHPSRQLQVVVVSGCSARSAVAHLLHELFVSAGIPTGLVSSLGCRMGERVLPPLPAEVEALDVQEWLAGMHRAGARACVLEVPPAAIARGCLAAAELDAVLLTDLAAATDPSEPSADGGGEPVIGPGSEFTFRARGRAGGTGGLWRLTDLRRGGTGRGHELAVRLQGGTLTPMTVRATLRDLSPQGTQLEATTPRGSLAVRLPFPGRPSAQAALAAATVALALNLPLAAVAAGLRRARAVPGRLDPVPTGHDFQVLVDGCSSAAELECTLRTVQEFTPGRVLLLFGCGARHEAGARPTFGEVAARGADMTVLTSDNPGWEAPEVISAQVASGYLRVRGALPRVVPDRSQAIRELLAAARPGDCVVLAGKGHRTVQELAGCILPFDDRAHAEAALLDEPEQSLAPEEVAA
ncbi:MAG: hypothetical protein HS113_05920 [Verrucomicrobiales bacterium]|nr:hypothetical protein [Verrucomicrobiales bacterium]